MGLIEMESCPKLVSRFNFTQFPTVVRVSKGHYYKYAGLLGVEILKLFTTYMWQHSASIKIPEDSKIEYKRNPLIALPSDLVIISAQNFTKEILGSKNKNFTWLLEFNSIWASIESQIYAPMLELIATLYNTNHTNPVRIARVDCSLPINGLLCRNFKIDHLPTYILIKEEKYRIYAEDISMTNLVKFIRKGHKDYQAYPVPLRSRNDGIEELFGVIDDYLHNQNSWVYIKWFIVAGYCAGVLGTLVFVLGFYFCFYFCCCKRKKTVKYKGKKKRKTSQKQSHTKKD